MEANRPAERMDAIASEIAATRPDLVAIQEAAVLRTHVSPDGPASPAETVTCDLRSLLRASLAARGSDYRTGVVATLELPR